MVSLLTLASTLPVSGAFLPQAASRPRPTSNTNRSGRLNGMGFPLVIFITLQFLGGQCTHAERVDVGFHQVAQRLVPQPVALDGIQALEAVGHDGGGKVPAAAARAGMTGVLCAFVDNVEAVGRKLLPQTGLDTGNAIAGAALFNLHGIGFR